MNQEQYEKLKRKIEKNADKIQQNTGALEILKTFKADTNKFFIMWIITFVSFLALLGYTVYLLNDINNITTTTTQEVEQENENGNNNFIGRDGDING